jgi:TrmH family RNA methyltransferase
MFAVQKLLKLEPYRRLRKICQVIRDYLRSGTFDQELERSVISSCLGLIPASILENTPFSPKIPDLSILDKNRLFTGLRQVIAACEDSLGDYRADWDFCDKKEGTEEEPGLRQTFPIFLYLDGIRSPYNMGAIFRSAESFGIRKIWLSSECCDPRHPRAVKTAKGCVDLVDWEYGTLSQADVPVFGMETGGIPLEEFPFPAKGMMVIGSEEWGINPVALSACKEGAGIVSIDTGGRKGSLNVSVATGIILQKWFSSVRQFRT